MGSGRGPCYNIYVGLPKARAWVRFCEYYLPHGGFVSTIRPCHLEVRETPTKSFRTHSHPLHIACHGFEAGLGDARHRRRSCTQRRRCFPPELDSWIWGTMAPPLALSPPTSPLGHSDLFTYCSTALAAVKQFHDLLGLQHRCAPVFASPAPGHDCGLCLQGQIIVRVCAWMRT